jgi:TRAP-type C4-dicarboxylate transport system substrate-binding protein
MKGLKIRVTQSPEAIKMVEGLGAQATAIPWSELYGALQQKVVDGEENPLSMIEQAKLYEVQKYLTMDGHTLGVLPITINEKAYQALSSDYKNIVKDSAQQAIAIFRAQLYLGNTLWVDHLKEKKMVIYTPTAAEYKQFQEAAQKAVIPYVRSKIGNEWVDAVLKAIKDVEKTYFER